MCTQDIALKTSLNYPLKTDKIFLFRSNFLKLLLIEDHFSNPNSEILPPFVRPCKFLQLSSLFLKICSFMFKHTRPSHKKCSGNEIIVSQMNKEIEGTEQVRKDIIEKIFELKNKWTDLFEFQLKWNSFSIEPWTDLNSIKFGRHQFQGRTLQYSLCKNDYLWYESSENFSETKRHRQEWTSENFITSLRIKDFDYLKTRDVSERINGGQPTTPNFKTFTNTIWNQSSPFISPSNARHTYFRDEFPELLDKIIFSIYSSFISFVDVYDI